MDQLGLSSKGSKDELIHRHREFVVRYASEMDRLDPCHTQEIVSEVNKETTSDDVAKRAFFVEKPKGDRREWCD